MIHRKEQLIDIDYSTLWKVKTESNLVILIIIVYFMSIIPLNTLSKHIISLPILTYLLQWYTTIRLYMQPALITKEDGRRIWIFEKYRFSPTSAKRMCRVKLLRLAKFCSKHLILSLLIQVSTTLLFVRKLTYMNFIPIAVFFLIFSYQSLNIIYHARKAFRKD